MRSHSLGSLGSLGSRVRTSPLMLALLFTATTASADSFQAARFEMAETAHRARVVFDRGSARIVVQRTVHNPGDRSDEATWHIDARSGAVAVALRTAGVSKDGAPLWFDGELMEAEAAAAKYKELTGRGGFYPKDPALLSWRSSNELALQVFPVLGKSDKTVEYTLVVSTRYEHGLHVLDLPAATEGMLPATVTVVAARAGDEVLINGVPADASTKVKLDRELVVALRPRVTSTEPAAGTLSTLEVSKGKEMTHARVFVAPRISRVPDDVAVAIVIDASRSMAKLQANAFAAARSYLSHFRAASVDIVTFDRAVHRLTERAVSPADAIALLAKTTTKPANGSRVDDALASADALLANRPQAAKRILLLSDLLVRDELNPQRLATRALKSGALVHVAQLVGGAEAHLTRDDGDRWTPVAIRTGGVFWRAEHPERVDEATRRVMEEWARPVRVDDARIEGLEVADFPSTLDEGQGFESWTFEAAAPSAFTIAGLMWSKAISVRVARSDAESKRSSALVFGSPLLDELSEPEMMTLARHGRAVSPVTSYLAIEPGVRPSTEGLEEGEGGGGVGAGIGLGSVRMAAASATQRSRFDLQAFFQTQLGAAAKRCGARDSVRVTVETTSSEIVHVARAVHSGARDVAVEACLREAAWNVELPADFDESIVVDIEVRPV